MSPQSVSKTEATRNYDLQSSNQKLDTLIKQKDNNSHWTFLSQQPLTTFEIRKNQTIEQKNQISFQNSQRNSNEHIQINQTKVESQIHSYIQKKEDQVKNDESEIGTIKRNFDSEKHGSSKFLQYSQNSIDNNKIKTLLNLNKSTSGTQNNLTITQLENIPSSPSQGEMLIIEPEKKLPVLQDTGNQITQRVSHKKNIKPQDNQITLRVVPIKLMECKNLDQDLYSKRYNNRIIDQITKSKLNKQNHVQTNTDMKTELTNIRSNSKNTQNLFSMISPDHSINNERLKFLKTNKFNLTNLNQIGGYSKNISQTSIQLNVRSPKANNSQLNNYSIQQKYVMNMPIQNPIDEEIHISYIKKVRDVQNKNNLKELNNQINQFNNFKLVDSDKIQSALEDLKNENSYNGNDLACQILEQTAGEADTQSNDDIQNQNFIEQNTNSKNDQQNKLNTKNFSVFMSNQPNQNMGLRNENNSTTTMKLNMNQANSQLHNRIENLQNQVLMQQPRLKILEQKNLNKQSQNDLTFNSENQKQSIIEAKRQIIINGHINQIRVSHIQSQMSSIVNKYNSDESTLQNLKSIEHSPKTIRSNLKSYTKNDVNQLKEEISESLPSVIKQKPNLLKKKFNINEKDKLVSQFKAHDTFLLANELDKNFKDIAMIKNQMKNINQDKIESMVLPNGSIIQCTVFVKSILERVIEMAQKIISQNNFRQKSKSISTQNYNIKSQNIDKQIQFQNQNLQAQQFLRVANMIESELALPYVQISLPDEQIVKSFNDIRKFADKENSLCLVLLKKNQIFIRNSTKLQEIALDSLKQQFIKMKESQYQQELIEKNQIREHLLLSNEKTYQNGQQDFVHKMQMQLQNNNSNDSDKYDQIIKIKDFNYSDDRNRQDDSNNAKDYMQIYQKNFWENNQRFIINSNIPDILLPTNTTPQQINSNKFDLNIQKRKQNTLQSQNESEEIEKYTSKNNVDSNGSARMEIDNNDGSTIKLVQNIETIIPYEKTSLSSTENQMIIGNTQDNQPEIQNSDFLNKINIKMEHQNLNNNYMMHIAERDTEHDESPIKLQDQSIDNYFQDNMKGNIVLIKEQKQIVLEPTSMAYPEIQKKPTLISCLNHRQYAKQIREEIDQLLLLREQYETQLLLQKKTNTDDYNVLAYNHQNTNTLLDQKHKLYRDLLIQSQGTTIKYKNNYKSSLLTEEQKQIISLRHQKLAQQRRSNNTIQDYNDIQPKINQQQNKKQQSNNEDFSTLDKQILGFINQQETLGAAPQTQTIFQKLGDYQVSQIEEVISDGNTDKSHIPYKFHDDLGILPVHYQQQSDEVNEMVQQNQKAQMLIFGVSQSSLQQLQKYNEHSPLSQTTYISEISPLKQIFENSNQRLENLGKPMQYLEYKKKSISPNVNITLQF